MSETLTLSGLDTLNHYQQVLDSVTFVTTGNDPTHGGSSPNRTIAWQVDDGSAFTMPARPASPASISTSCRWAPTSTATAITICYGAMTMAMLQSGK